MLVVLLENGGLYEGFLLLSCCHVVEGVFEVVELGRSEESGVVGML